MVQIADASSVLPSGAQADLGGVEELAQGEYKRAVKVTMPRDFVLMYHPDGTTSVVQLPAVPPDRPPSAKVIQERQQKIMHYVLNKRRRSGEQWWYASPPPGWKAAQLPYRCPVQGCERAGGLPDLLNLWRHIQQKHPGEVELYQGVLSAIKDRLMQSVPEDLQRLLDDEQAPILDEADAAIAAAEPPIPAETFGVPYACGDCDWKPKPDAKNARLALLAHRRHKHKEGE